MLDIEKIKDEISQNLLSGIEFNDILDFLVNESDDEIQGVYYTCNLNNNEDLSLNYGIKGVGKCTYNANNINIGNDIFIDISIWTSNKKYNIELMKDIFEKYWNSKQTIKASGIMSTHSDEIIKKCQRYIDKCLEKGEIVALFTMDLDNFKSINDTYDMDTGDAVIREFANVLICACKNRGVLIHRSGDEFYLIYSVKNYCDVVSLAWDLFCEVSNHGFNYPKKKLTFSLGIKLLESQGVVFDEEVKASQKLYRPSENKKNRKSVRIGKETYREDGNSVEPFKIAVCRILANIFNTNVFHNIYLDYLSDVLCQQEGLDTLSNSINMYLLWIGYDAKSNRLRCCRDDDNWDTSNQISAQEIGLSVFKGLLNNKNLCGKDIKIIFERESFCVFVAGVEVFGLTSISDISHDCVLQRIVPNVLANNIIDNKATKKVVLLQAGYDYDALPKDIFYKTVKVDSRPYIGGGLPDSWAAALCELISAMEENQNFKKIIVFGDTSSTYKIKTYLEKIEEWSDDNSKLSYDYISKKTFKNNNQIRSFQNKFKKSILMVEKEEELIDKLYEYYCTDDLDYSVCIQSSNLQTKRFLHRDLSKKEITLDVFDGCKAKSLSDAYPIVLEILRQKYQSKMFPETVDQAKRKLLELTNFIIILENPQKNDLPYYYIEDGKELDDYYNETFINPEGLFRKAIERNGQLDCMLEHVYTIINNSELRFATRRAILVLSNEMTNNSDYSPLGLVSIWLCPRYSEDGKNLTIDFSFTWRTVEALVGLPMSLYSSINFADYLLQRINKHLDSITSHLLLKMGKISYFAYSLHMFLDKENMNIIRGIVNEATF